MMRHPSSHCLLLLLALTSGARAQDHSQHRQTNSTQQDSTSTQNHVHHERGQHQPADTTHGDHRQHASDRVAPHVPPEPPRNPMRDMSEEGMIELMEMDDTSAFLMVRADSFEWRDTDDGDVFSWDAQGWYGGDYAKLWLETEGEAREGDVEARNELLVDRVIGRWWSMRAGLRHDVREGPSRSWAAIGIQGLAPYWFEIEATAYVGEEGRTALRVSAEYEVLLTQRLILQPELELDLYGRADKGNLIGGGLADAELALRLRYEIRREIAPYVGVSWQRRFGETADLTRAAGHDRSELQWLAGVRWWF